MGANGRTGMEKRRFLVCGLNNYTCGNSCSSYSFWIRIEVRLVIGEATAGIGLVHVWSRVLKVCDKETCWVRSVKEASRTIYGERFFLLA